MNASHENYMSHIEELRAVLGRVCEALDLIAAEYDARVESLDLTREVMARRRDTVDPLRGMMESVRLTILSEDIPYLTREWEFQDGCRRG